MEDEVVLQSELLDVTSIDFDQLDALPESVLRASLRRILDERLAGPDRYETAFENALWPDVMTVSGKRS